MTGYNAHNKCQDAIMLRTAKVQNLYRLNYKF